MTKKIIMAVLLLSMIFVFTGCDWDINKTEIIIKNNSSSTSNIRYVTIKQYPGGAESRDLVNALVGIDQLEPGDSHAVEIAPVSLDAYPLEVYVMFMDDSDGTCYITHEANKSFTLSCNNVLADMFYVFPGDGAALVPEDN